jgi:hypothetical protein
MFLYMLYAALHELQNVLTLFYTALRELQTCCRARSFVHSAARSVICLSCGGMRCWALSLAVSHSLSRCLSLSHAVSAACARHQLRHATQTLRGACKVSRSPAARLRRGTQAQKHQRQPHNRCSNQFARCNCCSPAFTLLNFHVACFYILTYSVARIYELRICVLWWHELWWNELVALLLSLYTLQRNAVSSSRERRYRTICRSSTP